MKLDATTLDALRKAVEQFDGANEFAARAGINPANISRYLSGKVKSVSDDNWAKLEPLLALELTPSAAPGTIRNTPELRKFLRHAMATCGVADMETLRRRIGYDNTATLERLFKGEINFFPDMLGALFDSLNIDPLDAPVSRAERELLPHQGIFNDGAMLVRPIPVVDWANALGYLEQISGSGAAMVREWDPQSTPTVPAPVGTRRDTQAFRVAGVSMEPKILDGDIIFVEPAASLEQVGNNRIVVAKFKDSMRFPECVICKRFRREGDLLCFSSDNPDGRFFTAAPIDIEWIGVVVRKISEL